MHICRVGQNHTFLGIYGVYTVFFGREITIYTVIYGVYIRFWPTDTCEFMVCIRSSRKVMANPTHAWLPPPPMCLSIARCVRQETRRAHTHTHTHTRAHTHIHTRTRTHTQARTTLYTVINSVLCIQFWPTLHMNEQGKEGTGCRRGGWE